MYKSLIVDYNAVYIKCLYTISYIKYNNKLNLKKKVYLILIYCINLNKYIGRYLIN